LTFRYYTGLLSQQHRSASSLEGLLQDFFGVTVKVIQLVGQWLPLEQEHQSQLTPHSNVALGTNAVAGSRYWDRGSKFRVQLGPLRWADFCDLLPSGNGYRQLADLARLFAGPTLDMDARLILRASDVPCCHLSPHAEADPRLGWNTWLSSGTFTHDADDAILALETSF
jgi:type VI secretion system protein ImpH